MRLALDCSHYAIPGGGHTYIGNLLSTMAELESDNEYILYHRFFKWPKTLPVLPQEAHTIRQKTLITDRMAPASVVLLL